MPDLSDFAAPGGTRRREAVRAVVLAAVEAVLDGDVRAALEVLEAAVAAVDQSVVDVDRALVGVPRSAPAVERNGWSSIEHRLDVVGRALAIDAVLGGGRLALCRRAFRDLDDHGEGVSTKAVATLGQWVGVGSLEHALAAVCSRGPLGAGRQATWPVLEAGDTPGRSVCDRRSAVPTEPSGAPRSVVASLLLVAWLVERSGLPAQVTA